MQCPKCGIEMDEVRKLDVVIDVCGRCGGTWLDRGELDKLRASTSEVQQDRYRSAESGHGHSDDRGYSHDDGKKQQKKSGFDLLDLFG
ncbi:MAG: hypothetical protein HGA39_05740 [Coriobacteriia bacterium]|nr:hypothetical protein [Coriobacteriia bacterium]